MTTPTYSELFGIYALGKQQQTLEPTLDERLFMWKLAGYQPSPRQWEAHLNHSRLKLIAGGERGGKSYSAAMELIARHHLGTLFWLVGPNYKLCRPEFIYLMSFFQKIGAVESVSFPSSPFQPCSMILKGGIEIHTITAKDTQQLAGRAPDGILGCEAAQLDFEAYLKMLGRLSEKNGWLWLSGTFESNSYMSWYGEQYEKWIVENDESGAAFSLPTWENRSVYPGGLQDPKILELRAKSPNEEWFLERYGGIPCPPPSAVFKEFRLSIHADANRALGFRPNLLDKDGKEIKNKDGKPRPWEVELAVDPGYNGAYAVNAIQVDGPYVYVIDEVYQQWAKAEDIIEECKKRDWWPNVRRGVLDIAGTQHQGMASHFEVWARHAKVYLESVRVDIIPGIARMRTFLKDGTGQPRIFYNPKCKDSIKEFNLYRYREVEEGKVTSEKPIDAFNHSAKAIAYWLVARYGFVDATKRPRNKRIVYGRRSPSIKIRTRGTAATAGIR